MWLLMATVLVTLPNCGDDGDKVAPNDSIEKPNNPNDGKEDTDGPNDEDITPPNDQIEDPNNPNGEQEDTNNPDDGQFIPSLTVEPEKLYFTSNGGAKDIQITSNITYEVSINADYWISILELENKIRVYVGDNDTPSVKQAEITIRNLEYGITKTIIVEQASAGASLIVEPNILNFPNEGGTLAVNISANCEYEIKANVDWLTISKSYNGIYVTATANSSSQSRQASIIIACIEYNMEKTIHIEQAAYNPFLIVDPIQLNFSSEGGSQEIKITSHCEYEITENANWLAVSLSSEGIEVIVGANNNTQNRQTEIHISCLDNSRSQIVNVSQAGISANNSNTILYTSYNNSIIIPYNEDAFGATIISNTYDSSQQKGVIVFDNTITSIGDFAFYNSTDLTSIEIPNSVTYIGKSAFNGCSRLGSNLTNNIIPDNVTSIGDYAFMDCDALTNIYIGNNVKKIGNSAFFDCNLLSSVHIGNSVWSIGNTAFYNCKNIRQIDLPKSVTMIGDYAFGYCSNLTTVYCRPTTPPNKYGTSFDYIGPYCHIYVPRESYNAYVSSWGTNLSWGSLVPYDFEQP